MFSRCSFLHTQFLTMDWFSGLQKNLTAAAQDAAERAQKLAQQASVQAKVYAEQATEKAKALAAQAAEEAQQQIAQLKQAAAASSSASGSQHDISYYGITDMLLDHVSSMSYNTFSDALAAMPEPAAGGSDSFRLNPWQEKHAMLVLGRVEQLQHLRYALCPKRMEEQQFWTIYFSEVKSLLPAQAFGAPEEPSSRPAATQSSSKATTSSAPAGASSSTSTGQSTAAKHDDGTGSAGRTDAPAATSSSRSLAPGSQSSPAPAASSSGAAPGLADAQDDVLDADGDDEDEDVQLDELEDDPELAAYLQEALALDDEQGEDLGSADLGSVADEDLDDYINQLQEEEEGLSKLSTPAKGPANSTP